jgi:two-component sensor histidine kinase
MAALNVLALAPALQSGNFEAFKADAERFLTRFPASTAIFVADADGAQLFNTNVGGTIDRPEVLEAIRAVFAEKRPQVSNVYHSRRAGQLAFTVNVPVMHNEEVVYSLGFNAPRGAFLDILTQLDLPSGWVIALFDRNAHHVVRRPTLAQDAVTSASDSLKAELARADERLVETTSVEGTRVLTVFTRSPETGLVVAVGVPVDQFKEPTLRTLVTTFSIGALLILSGGFFAVRIASQLVRAEGHRELLVNELNHRVKNTLSAVQAIVWRGLRNSGAAPEVRQGIDARLQALSSAHNILSRKNWEGAYADDVIASITAPYAGPQASRVRLQGPHVALHPRVAIPLAMIINELATNAVKYGALSTGSGVVDIAWSMINNERLKITWAESGGPRVQPPTQTGYGTKFIERAVVDELGGKYAASYPAKGMICDIEIAL